MAKTETIMHPCDGCGRSFDINTLDSVLLDADECNASETIYCRSCWPRFRRVDTDKYSSMYGDSE